MIFHFSSFRLRLSERQEIFGIGAGRKTQKNPTNRNETPTKHLHHHRHPPMSLFRDNKWSGILTTGLVAFSSGITIYLLISDTARRTEIRRRKNTITAAEDVLTAAPERFATLRIGGRFVNPFEEYQPPEMEKC